MMRGKKRDDLEERLLQVENLLRKKAWTAWKRMPFDVKLWIDPEDLYHEAVVEIATKWRLYDPSRGAWTTFCWSIVQNHFSKLVTYYSAAKRRSAGTVPVDAVDWERESVAADGDPLVDRVVRCLLEMSPVR